MEDSFSNDPDLTAIRYNPPGAPAQAVALLATIPFSRLDSERGLDHGAWSILVHLFPCADVPVFQMSLDRNRTLREANVLGERIRPLREQGVLIVGSGNICHNMRESNFNPHAAPLPWNMQFDEFVAELIRRSELDSLAYPFKFAPAVAPYALPTNEHYAPFLYSLGASTSEDVIETIYTGYEHAAISLRSYIWRDKSCSRP
jgi:4,5-DOPA dioxygenase extradiol